MKKRRSNRIPEFDYSTSGSYFITICTYKMNCIFGEINNEKMILDDCGKIAEKYWLEIPMHFPRAEMDSFIVMPNHIHGIINIIDDVGARHVEPGNKQNKHVGARHVEPGINKYQRIIPGSIGSIIRSYKSAVTKWIHKNTTINNVWQRNYYEYIIQNDNELYRIQEYIYYNPLNWQIEKIERHNIFG
ncbi:MAG: transposase [Candidatus Marinimicrobia bacterium]|nr:transposase [Candidatus Neomarinimicrobiota bacterium]